MWACNASISITWELSRKAVSGPTPPTEFGQDFPGDLCTHSCLRRTGLERHLVITKARAGIQQLAPHIDKPPQSPSPGPGERTWEGTGQQWLRRSVAFSEGALGV